MTLDQTRHLSFKSQLSFCLSSDRAANKTFFFSSCFQEVPELIRLAYFVYVEVASFVLQFYFLTRHACQVTDSII